MPRVDLCACGALKQSDAMRCRACYRVWTATGPTYGACVDCGEHGRLRARGMDMRCYKRWSRTSGAALKAASDLDEFWWWLAAETRRRKVAA